MLIPCNINVVTATNDVRWLYAIYMHMDVDDKVQYVGVTPLSELFKLTDAQCNSKWAEVFSRDNNGLRIFVHSLTSDEREAHKTKSELVTKYQPYCNLKGFWISPERQRVVCNETGESFETIKAAADAHNLTYSQLYNHVNGKPGHKTVKGRTYRRTL